MTKVTSPFATVFLLLVPAVSIAQPAKPAEQVYKNIKVLQGTSADSFNQGMHLISAALGVSCEYCHKEMDFVSDEVKIKDVARRMITMTAELNQRAFEGKQVITCYTCHQGNAIPRGTPLLPLSPASAEKPQETNLPSAEQVLSRYVAALGGEANLRKVTSRIITGEQDIPTGPGGVNPTPAQIEVYQKAPNLMLRVAKTKQATLENGFDGKTAWIKDARGRVNPPAELEQVRERGAADMFEPLNMAKQYTGLKVEGTQKIGTSNTYVLAGQFAAGAIVRLYFDTTSGLLLRRYTVVPTAAGDSPFHIDYADYRDAGSGVKYPFTLRMEPAGPRTELPTSSAFRIQRIQENAAIEDSKFIKPESKDTPPAR